MKIKTAYLGIKLEPDIKLNAMSQAKKERVQFSAWIRSAIVEKLAKTGNGRKAS